MPTPIEDIVEAQPADEHNRLLVSRVHPPDWVNPAPRGRYNLAVVGAGTAGLVTAAGAAGLGAKVALIERNLMGGDCLNVGCVPSKALLRAAQAMADLRRAPEFGIDVPDGAALDFGKTMERMRRLRAGIGRHDSAARFKELGVDVYIGEAKFTGRNTIAVEGASVQFAKACIATGARPARAPVPGLWQAGALTNETVFSLTELPPRLAVIGAGPIGVEMAQCFARFGARVTLLENRLGILGREDRAAAAVVEKSLIRDGVRVCCRRNVVSVRREDGEKVLEIENAESGEREAVRVDEILVGAGRAPNVENLGLEAAGVRCDARGGVAVDDFLRTSNRGIYAAGDVCSPYKFTHAADAMARIVIGNALFFGRGRTSALTIPWCTYTDPEIARVGLYEHEAEEKGIALDTFSVEMSAVDRAVLESAGEGFVKIHCRKGTDRILGAAVVARHAGEMISEITTAMAGGVGLGSIAKTVHPYPTQAEAVKKAADAYNRTRLTPRVKRLLGKILEWRR